MTDQEQAKQAREMEAERQRELAEPYREIAAEEAKNVREIYRKVQTDNEVDAAWLREKATEFLAKWGEPRAQLKMKLRRILRLKKWCALSAADMRAAALSALDDIEREQNEAAQSLR